MLIELSNSVGNYLHDVFIKQFDWWIVLGFVAQAIFTARFAVQWLASDPRDQPIRKHRRYLAREHLFFPVFAPT